jgi:hypothetical protein
MPFEIDTPTAAMLVSVTPRTEVHGEDRVFAISLGLKVTGPNTLLDRLTPTLRPTLYKPVDDQQLLPGVETSTPVLRTRGIEVLHLAGKLEGWLLAVDHGLDADDPITLGGCRVDHFRVMPREGGTVDLLFRIGSNDIDAEEAGLLCSKLSQEISITLKPPVRVPDPIDASSSAKDLPPDATDLFSAEHGAEAPDSTQERADEGGEGQGSGEGSEGSWPFPKDDPDQAPPQSVVVETSRPGTRTARGRERTKAALAAREGAE